MPVSRAMRRSLQPDSRRPKIRFSSVMLNLFTASTMRRRPGMPGLGHVSWYIFNCPPTLVHFQVPVAGTFWVPAEAGIASASRKGSFDEVGRLGSDRMRRRDQPLSDLQKQLLEEILQRTRPDLLPEI